VEALQQAAPAGVLAMAGADLLRFIADAKKRDASRSFTVSAMKLFVPLRLACVNFDL
jgi:hypothetical protein